MAVDQLGAQVEQRDRFERGPAEEHEPLAVVFVVVAVFAIELGPIVVLRLVDEVDGHLVARQRAAQEVPATVLRPIGTSNRDAGRLDRPAAVERLPKRGHDDDRLVAELGQLQRQAAANVAQSARFAERHRLGRGKEDFHGEASCQGPQPIARGASGTLR